MTICSTEGSLFTDGLMPGDVNLNGNVSDLYTSGPISLDPVFEELRSTTLPEQLVVPIHPIGFDLLDENPILESYVEVITLSAFDTLYPVVPSKADPLSVKGDFDLRGLLGGELRW